MFRIRVVNLSLFLCLKDYLVCPVILSGVFVFS